VTEFRVVRFDNRGAQVSARSYRYRPMTLAEDHIAIVIDELVWRFTRLPMLRGRETVVRRTIRDALPTARLAPPVWSVVAADDGSLWL